MFRVKINLEEEEEEVLVKMVVMSLGFETQILGEGFHELQL